MQVIIKPKGTIRQISVTDYSVYGDLQSSWTYNGIQVQLYAKTSGIKMNKFDFPPPADQKPFFGTCLLVNPHGDLSIDMWNRVYEGIMQFEDIYTDTETESEEEVIQNATRQGYEKDGFVVSDSEEII
jgi:hypothetical protein